jgi:nucleosome assembly protein 1-like 1
MGKKKTPEGEKVPLKEAREDNAPEEKEEEDPPIVKELKEIDDKYLELEREYEKKVQELQRQYNEKQTPLLEQRKQVLTNAKDAGDSFSGTPALKGFWLQAMKHLPALEDQIEEWDEPVLEYCSDVTKTYLSEELHKGFKLTFHFVENPYFTNETLWKEYHTQESSPYTGEIDTTEIKACEIDWKPGKDVTIEKVAKKVKGGGAKKTKQKAKEKEEPRDSFFRNFFRTLKPDMPLPDDVNMSEMREMMEQDSDDDDEQMMGLLMENDYEVGTSVRDQLVPFAVRWYTGEAQPDGFFDDDDDFDEDDEEDDDDDDEDDDEESDDDEPVPKKKAQPKKKGGGGGPNAKAEECKQQ